MQHLRKHPIQDTQISWYLAVQNEFEIVVQFEFVPRNLIWVAGSGGFRRYSILSGNCHIWRTQVYEVHRRINKKVLCVLHVCFPYLTKLFHVPHVHLEEYRMHSLATEYTWRTQNTFFSNSHEEHSVLHFW